MTSAVLTGDITGTQRSDCRKVSQATNLKTIQVGVEAVATGYIADEPHGQLTVDL